MKRFRQFRYLVWLILVLALVTGACKGSAPAQDPNRSDLWVVTGPNAASVTGNGNDGLLLDQWAKQEKVSVFVQTMSGPEARLLKEKVLAGAEGPDVFIFDDGLYAEGLRGPLSVAQASVGLWIEDSAATAMGLSRGVNIISMDQYVGLMDSGVLAVAAGNALTSSSSAEHFFGILAWCSKQDTANLTIDMVNDQATKECGKTVYDHIKTTASTSDAIKLVTDGVVNKQANSYNAVIAFDSSFLGENGRNQMLLKEAGSFMRFFYFKEASPVSVVTFGSKDLSDQQTKKDLVYRLGEYLIGDEAQRAFNKAGFGVGASSMAIPDDSAFLAEWGVMMYPSKYVNSINPPVTAVAFDALTVYAQYYKRMKEINFCIDTSESTSKVDNGTMRLQSIDRAIVTVTNPSWQSNNGIVIGNRDIMNYRLFSSSVSPVIVSSVGPETKGAGDYINSLIGPAEGDYNFWVNEQKVQQIDPFYKFSGTAMFDCAELFRNEIESRYNTEVDYYIVILTDGAKTVGIDFNWFKRGWDQAGHKNISLIGIQFGNEGSDVSEKVVSQVNGKNHDGTNAEELIEAFKDIFSN